MSVNELIAYFLFSAAGFIYTIMKPDTIGFKTLLVKVPILATRKIFAT